MKLIDEIKSLGYDLTLQDDNIKFVYRGQDKPDQEKVRPLVEEIKASKAQVVKELTKDLCQKCLTRQWQRLCWGTHANGYTGWWQFCLKCEPYPHDLHPEMLRK